MLLTNTQNTLTNNITTGNGLVIVCGVEFGGPVCRPEHFADRQSGKRAAAKRISAGMHAASRATHSMYSGDQDSWQQPWLDSPSSLPSASGLSLGCESSLS